jgi:hypothetical protein
MKLILKNHTEGLDDHIFQQISEYERREYGEGSFREPKKLKKFAKAYPQGFAVLLDENTNEVVATADFYPLDRLAWEGLADGLVIEEKLPSSAIIDGENQFYIASLIVRQPSRGSFVGTPAVFRKLVNYLWGTLAAEEKPLQVLGVGSTDKGKILLNNWGFKPHEGHPNKKDFRPRYILDDKSGEQCLLLSKEYSKKVEK